MAMNEHFKFLMENRIHDGLLREFVGKGLWEPAITACNEGIEKRLVEVENLRSLKERMLTEISVRETT